MANSVMLEVIYFYYYFSCVKKIKLVDRSKKDFLRHGLSSLGGPNTCHVTCLKASKATEKIDESAGRQSPNATDSRPLKMQMIYSAK